MNHNMDSIINLVVRKLASFNFKVFLKKVWYAWPVPSTVYNKKVISYSCDHLSGFNVCNRYLMVLYNEPTKVSLENNFLDNIYLSKVSNRNTRKDVKYAQSNH